MPHVAEVDESLQDSVDVEDEADDSLQDDPRLHEADIPLKDKYKVIIYLYYSERMNQLQIARIDPKKKREIAGLLGRPTRPL